MSLYLALDFGGTRSRAALFDGDMRMIRRAETPSRVNEGPDRVFNRLIGLGKSLTDAEGAPASIGIAAPGPLDTGAGVIIKAETLPGWSQAPIGATMSQAFAGAPVAVENDANLGAVAEYHLGAGQGADPMLYLTISTGIGGGAIINGELYTGFGGLAIEPGHMRFRSRDGAIRRWEELASGTALGNLARRQLKAGAVSAALRESDLLDGKAVGEAALAGDGFALECLRQVGAWLGLGLVNLLHLFNPAAIVLGGSVMKLGDLILDPARQVIEEQLLFEGFAGGHLLRPARFGDDVCLVGAALLARRKAGPAAGPL